MNLFTKQKETHRHRKQTYGYQRGSMGGGKNEIHTTIHEKGKQIHTTIYEKGKQTHTTIYEKGKQIHTTIYEKGKQQGFTI